MLEINGKTAVISGGADGIGFDLGMNLGKAGMNIVLADIEEAQLAQAEAAMRDAGIPVLAVAMDVALREDWQRTAELTQQRFGDVHMLVNNAGVGGGIGALETLDEPGWRWAIDVNLMGVVYGANTFVPLLKQHGEAAWLLNVASMAGMAGVPLGGAYTATKAAVVALSESWYDELKDTSVHVSVLAPAFVKTRIHLSHRNRQARYAPVSAPTPDVLNMARVTTQAVENGIDAGVVSARVLEALEQGELYIFTHPNYSVVTQQRGAAVAGAFERAAQSPHLAGIADQDVTLFDR